MKTVVYLSNRTVKAVVGKVENDKLVIARAFEAEAPKLSIVNGQVTDEAAFTSFLREFWEKNQLPKKEVGLVINSTKTVVHFLDAPKMSRRKMMEYLSKEFLGAWRMEEPVYSCSILGRGDGPFQYKICASAVERSFLEEHIRRFRLLGIRLVSVETALEAQLRLFGHMVWLKDKVCAVQLLDGMTLMNILYANGKFIHFSRNRIGGSGKTAEIGTEWARALSALVQFGEAEQIEGEITAAYLGGLTKEQLEDCKKAVSRMRLQIRLYPFEEGAEGSIIFSEETKGCRLGNFAAAAGGLFSDAGRQGLFYQYWQNPNTMAHQKAIFHFYAPILGISILLTAVAAIQAASWFYLSSRVDACLDYAADAQVLAGAAEYDRLTEENLLLAKKIEVTEQIWEAAASYPEMGTKIDQVVERCADGLVTARVTAFQAENQMIQVSSTARDEQSIHRFVDRLAEETETFFDIRYTGFEYVESEEVWRMNVECYLCGRKEEEKP